MARSFTSRDARRLIEQHKEIKESLESLEQKEAYYKNEVTEAAKKIAGKEAYNLLKDVPIEEINRNKKGFKVKLLRDCGYNTIADISGASVASIAFIRGISEDTAYSIYNEVRKIVNQTTRNAKIKISVDNKTQESSKLVTALAKYRQSQEHIETSRRLLDQYGRQIDYAMEDLLPGTGGIGWLFTSKANKKKAEEAFNYLSNTLSSEYAEEAKVAKSSIDQIDRMHIVDAWKDFQDNSIRFFNVLEDVAPGLLGSGDSIYGLPEDLAREIQDQCFSRKGCCVSCVVIRNGVSNISCTRSVFCLAMRWGLERRCRRLQRWCPLKIQEPPILL